MAPRPETTAERLKAMSDGFERLSRSCEQAIARVDALSKTLEAHAEHLRAEFKRQFLKQCLCGLCGGTDIEINSRDEIICMSCLQNLGDYRMPELLEEPHDA